MMGRTPGECAAVATAAAQTSTASLVEPQVAASSAWGAVLPPTVRTLEQSLVSAFHAFDLIDLMTMSHRVRVVDEVTGAVVEAAFAATRAGHARWACMVLRAAADRPPTWSSLCTRWDQMIAEGLGGVNTVDWADRP